jgi:hypothetical protein
MPLLFIFSINASMLYPRHQPLNTNWLFSTRSNAVPVPVCIGTGTQCNIVRDHKFFIYADQDLTLFAIQWIKFMLTDKSYRVANTILKSFPILIHDPRSKVN